MYSDTQDNPEVWGRLAELGWLERPNFGVLTGDLVGRGGWLEDWLVDFFPPANVFMRRFPLFTVIGNHADDHPYYYQYMHNPPPEYRYTFRYGNAQFFIWRREWDFWFFFCWCLFYFPPSKQLIWR